MNSPRCDANDYIQFLLAAQRVYTCTEAARRQPEGEKAPEHNSFTRLLQRQPSGTGAPWHDVQGQVRRRSGLIALDDTTPSFQCTLFFITEMDVPAKVTLRGPACAPTGLEVPICVLFGTRGLGVLYKPATQGACGEPAAFEGGARPRVAGQLAGPGDPP